MRAKCYAILFICWCAPLLGSCATNPIEERLSCECIIPAGLPRAIDLRLKNGESRRVDAYRMYMDQFISGWSECLDRFMLGTDYLDTKGDSPLAVGTAEMFIRAREDGFNSALQQIDGLVKKYGYDHARTVVSRYIVPP